ncbi:MAG: MerR family transcriptional regulator [Solirubrobacteraceae bacterium]
MRIAEFRGAYTAERAAALSGVPRSTLDYWARNDILVPSISPAKVKLWSYTDLMGLRTIYWLRQRKVTTEGWQVPATAMPAVRKALSLHVTPHTVDADGIGFDDEVSLVVVGWCERDEFDVVASAA